MIDMISYEKDQIQRLEQRKAAFADAEGCNYVLLETCDRLELYRGDGEPVAGVLEHLCAVTCGLESPLIGEKAVQGQVKNAYQAAVDNGSVGSGLHRMFQYALRVGKDVRTRTKLDHGAVGHAQIVCDLLRERFPEPEKTQVVLVGVHEMNEAVLRFLSKAGFKRLVVTNRSHERAQALVNVAGGSVVHFDELQNALAGADALVTATAAPHPVIHKSDLPAHALLIADLAAPADLEPGAAAGHDYWDLPRLETRANQNLGKRQTQIQEAKNIIKESMEAWHGVTRRTAV